MTIAKFLISISTQVTTVAILMQHVIANLLPCPQVTFVDNTGTEKNGYLEVKSPSDVTWYKVLVSYEHPVISDDVNFRQKHQKLDLLNDNTLN